MQAALLKDVKALVTVLEDMGNHFLKCSQDLLVVDTRDTQVAETLRRSETIGNEQFTKFVTQRLEECTTRVTQKNKFPVFSRPPVNINSRQKTDEKEQLVALKSDCGLFSRLYISCQTRDGDIDNFFSHENQATPPALSTGGKMRIRIKSDLLRCLKSDLLEHSAFPVADAMIVDGLAVVQMINPGRARTFKECGELVFAPYISAQLEKCSRVDIVWDVYVLASLKASPRQKRGKSTRKRVAASTVMPNNWTDFLHIYENKTELFAFLSPEAIRFRIAPCSQGEADTRLLLHAADAVQKECMKVTILLICLGICCGFI